MSLNRRICLWIAGWSVCVLPQAAFAEAPAASGDIAIVRDVPYVPGGHPRQKLDLYLPREPGKYPLVIWIHGGAWEGGSRDWNRARMLMQRAECATATIDYRFSQDAPFPAQLEDCQAAIRWLREHAAEYHIDVNRIGVWGESAGGHLAALVGTADHLPEPEGPSARVQAVCDFFGPTDLSFYGDSLPGDLLSRLFGGPIQDHPQLVQAANPVTFASSDDPPFLILHGDKDELVPLKHSTTLQEKLDAAGANATLKVIPGGGHGLSGEQIDRMVAEFFIDTLGMKRKQRSPLSAVMNWLRPTVQSRTYPRPTPEQAAEIQRHQGEWIVTELKHDGHADAASVNAVRAVKGARNTLTLTNGISIGGAFQLNVQTTPRQIDTFFDSGLFTGEELLGIYELNGDQLRICLSQPQRERPKKFESVPGGGTVLMTLIRKPAPAEDDKGEE